jgi:ATP-dependent RNA helicase DDX31/DBP7
LDDDRTFRETALKKLEAIASSDKLQKKKKRRETKQAVGPLLESARNAYFSYVRGYSTKEKAVRHIFSARALHLGHVARSFALQEQPKELVKAHKLSGQSSQIDDEDLLRSTGKKRNNNLAFNKSNRKMKTEYADPLVDETPIPKTKKVKTSGVVSFFNNDNDNPKDDTQKQTSRNIKEKMMAAASSLQSSGMEFW